MPAWWRRKSSKSKNQEQQQQQSTGRGSQIDFNKADAENGKAKPSSFDEVCRTIQSRNSPKVTKEFASLITGASGSSWFDSDGAEPKGHPLPRPSVSSTQSFGNDHNTGLGSGSVSVSSVSSCCSSDDHLISQFDNFRLQSDLKFRSRSRSPGPGSRRPTSPTSPLHPKLHPLNLNLDYATGKREDERSECHPLPLPPCSPSSPSALSGSRTISTTENVTCNLPKWKKGKLLGRGSFGHVYLGFNSESGQMCAIKEVRVASDDQTTKESFKQLNHEINLLSHLSHTNIVQYYGSELSEETLSVYLEYVSGGSIHKLLQEYGPFKEPVIQNYTRQLVLGLAYLHERSTVHRDIKGANILVDPNGEIKLADFGMAKRITACSSMLSFKGSPYWMAPEVVMNTNGYSLAVDIWSLGCTLIEMSTSKPPWSQFEGVAAIFKIGNSKDIPEIPNHLSHDAKSFIKLCLQRDPSARPTAAQLLEHPFIRDQSITRVANTNLTREAFPYMFEGHRTPPVLELHTNRASMTTMDGDYKHAASASQLSRSPREKARMIMSLPVSPSSSPLRQCRPSYQNCYFSPPHPTFNTFRTANYHLVDLSSYPVRSNNLYTLDPFHETASQRCQTPGGSPRTRPL